MNHSLETIAQDGNRCGEAPLWDFRRQRMVWTDIESSVVYAYDPARGEKSVINRGLMVAGIALNRDNSLVFAGSTGLHLWRCQDDFRTLATKHEGEAFFFNDILAGPHGRLYAGTVYWGPEGMQKSGKLYLFNTRGHARVVDDGIQLSNGLGLSPDDRTLYYADSAVRKIFAYDADGRTGSLSNKRVFVTVPGDEGLPDGLTIDAQGFVWCAQWYGGQVVRYDPEGRVERRIPMPVTQVSSLAFGGPDLTDLYITTAADSWPSKLAPPGYDFNVPCIGGSFYRLRLGIQGRREHVSSMC
ncbi:MAG: SMP-30/gluconolactonase/LRE family protein [Planctomycetes bacterium]|nr:SMP-30/gluconolactonase/LRE family protein [Planctomycetota bacterium]